MAPGACQACQGTGFVVETGEDGIDRATRCSCRHQEEGSRLLKAARIPRRYEHCDLDNFDLFPDSPSLKRAHDAASRWLEEWRGAPDPYGLLFHGAPGTGKTHLAVGIVRSLVARDAIRALFWEQRELLKALQNTFGGESPTRESHVMGPVLDTEVLVLDDLGAGRTTEWARDVLHEIISHRYNNQLPMIITTNSPIGEPEKRGAHEQLTLKQRLGDALMSRLYEMCRFIAVESEDYRRKVKKADLTRY